MKFMPPRLHKPSRDPKLGYIHYLGVGARLGSFEWLELELLERLTAAKLS